MCRDNCVQAREGVLRVMKSTCKVHKPRAVKYHNGDGTVTCIYMYMYLCKAQLNTLSGVHNLWAMISAAAVDMYM